ncbi:urease accessory protein UreE [Alphaproteobacteria bacterium GH1-50]|uniref:Urease accessory protein UreE n=1 Tax=Kangsaoukella pontilimi TaxID=2691042 RepID=A0A7C9IS80_9RHOB|nr:urease accessory protein UreE [Kangsaoukella pontilimi]MXQ07705.1 urease accessory protein UreE [Kangsaoukella pontilimi]
MSLPRADGLAPAETGDDTVSLTYDARLLRRKRLVSESGRAFLVDLPETRSVDEGEAFLLDDGTRVAVSAAPEDLVAVTGGPLTRLAWHIGNRHTPCQIEAGRLLIARDHVLEAMLAHLGAEIAIVTEPFRPEGGAYGHGRTFGHSHGPDHGHSHGHGHNHGHDHSHDHGHDHSHDHDHGHHHHHHSHD